ncbi:hypothetical protein VKT23_019913 [Stygiomarasmius scandens]|uniref:Ribonuclease H1 N-terminal domain-containing protein n=1 Tax=Marasmiellus scandens TaxID=2682957 RepID=A0ABR1IK81_9AGAR
MSSPNHVNSESSVIVISDSDSSSDDLWQDLEDLGPYMAQVSLCACCRPQLFDSKTPGVNFQPKKWYVVFTGPVPGCYTTWADASSRVIGVKGAHYEAYDTYEQSLHGWRQNCLSHHRHPADFVDGTTYVPSSPPHPIAIMPPPDNNPTPVYTCTPPPTPMHAPQTSSSRPTSAPASPSKHRPVAAPQPQRRWAILADGISGVFDVEAGDAVLEEARLRAIPVQAREVTSLVEATEWLECLELATEADSE